MTRKSENAATLSSLLGITDEEAANLLEVPISITVDESDRTGRALAHELAKLLSRTVTSVEINPKEHTASIEVVIGAAWPKTSHILPVTVTEGEIQIGGSAARKECSSEIASVVPLIAACYTAGMALKAALGDSFVLPGPSPTEGMVISIADILGEDQSWIERETLFSDTYLAGAGAIGNGFLYGLSHFRPVGTLTIVDPDKVSDGNTNRCILFQDEDIPHPKALRLAKNAQSMFPFCELLPEEATIQQLGKRKDGRWLYRLIVAVDSRRARRSLQNEIPGEVFDASTTGAVECVLHHHKQPTELACLACVYHEAPDELARERHIAELLGVDIELVKQHYVTPEAAQQITQKYPNIPQQELAGQAYDSLFKALCGEQRLKTAENRQVLAPFAFVSVLAGVLLAIDVVRRLSQDDDAPNFNYFRLSPWAPPVQDLRQERPRNIACEFCSQQVLLETARRIWTRT